MTGRLHCTWTDEYTLVTCLSGAARPGWCWVTPSAEALLVMQRLVSRAIVADRDSIEDAALTAQIRSMLHRPATGGSSPRSPPTLS